MVVVVNGLARDIGYVLAQSAGPDRPTDWRFFSLATQNRRTFLACDGGDAAYLTLALCQTYLEFRATGRRARSLSLDNGLCCSNRCDARIGTGPKCSAAKTLSGSITKTRRKRPLLAGRNGTSVGASLLLGSTRDGLAVFYASCSDGGAIHRQGGSRGKQHHASGR
jgi:hypothetical protein